MPPCATGSARSRWPGRSGAFSMPIRDVLLDSDFVTFELETLMGMGPKVTIPVLTYLFHRIEQRLDGRPTLIIIDEAWVVLANATFGAKLEEWLRTLRKKNAAVVLATQSLSEIANSPYRDVILESCPTKLYLPNAEARVRRPASFTRSSACPIGRSTSSPRPRPSAITTTSRRWDGGSSSSRWDRRRWPSSAPGPRTMCSRRGG